MSQNINEKPYVLEETDDYAVVYKPPRMHTINKNSKFYHKPHELIQTKEEDKNTIYNWIRENINNINYLQIMHRLDFETHGLVLFAKNEKSFNYFRDLQDNGEFVKEYSAICKLQSDNPHTPHSSLVIPYVIESYFRPYGPGRKVVRPVIDDKKNHKETAKDKGGFYKTEIINIEKNIFTVRIKRGFRHQIRCHLCWIGFPIINDPLYPKITETHDFLALRSHAIFFSDPSTGKKLEYRIDKLCKTERSIK